MIKDKEQAALRKDEFWLASADQFQISGGAGRMQG